MHLKFAMAQNVSFLIIFIVGLKNADLKFVAVVKKNIPNKSNRQVCMQILIFSCFTCFF
jgi:hypothetical protein